MSTYIGRVRERCGAFSPHSHLPELALAYFLVGVREWDEAGYFFGSTTSERFDPTAVTLASGTARVYNAIVFGNSAIGKGVASDLHFTNEIDDHKNTVEVGGALINGYNRAEFLAESDAGEVSGDAFYKNQTAAHNADDLTAINQSSLIFSTEGLLAASTEGLLTPLQIFF